MSDYNVPKRVFFRGPVKKKTSVSFPEFMMRQLERIADENGYSVPELMGIVLDQYLVQEAKKGNADWPEGFDPSTLG